MNIEEIRFYEKESLEIIERKIVVMKVNRSQIE